MCVAGKGQADSHRDSRKRIRVMHQKQDWFVVMDLRQRRGYTVSSCPEVCEPAYPEALLTIFHRDGFILEHSYSARFQCMPDFSASVPPIMVSQNSNHAEGSAKVRKLVRDRLRWNEVSPEHAPDHLVAEQNDEIRLFSVHARYQPFE